MVETVKVRPNHYETLGLTPGASSEEIDQAFAREVNLIALRPLGTFARVSAAYEALRDPVRRLAYDASLAPPPRPSHSLIGRLERAPVNDRSEPRGMQPLSPRLEPEVPPASEPIAEPLPAEPLRQSPESGATNGQRSQWSQPPDQYFADQVDWRELEREARADRSIRPDVGGLVVNTAVGGALLLAIVLGAWTGLQSGNDNQRAQDLTTVQLPIPMATTATPGPAPASAPASSSSEQEVDPPEPTRQVAARPEPDRPPLQIDLPDEAPAKSAPADEASESPASELAAEPAAAPAMRTAKLPLPDAVVARTIGRIGYACGQVASTTAMEGEAPGTFKVTCTSGDSYRAAPVNGRYRFRHLGKR